MVMSLRAMSAPNAITSLDIIAAHCIALMTCCKSLWGSLWQWENSTSNKQDCYQYL